MRPQQQGSADGQAVARVRVAETPRRWGEGKRMAPCAGRHSSRSGHWRLISLLPCLSFPSTWCCPSRGEVSTEGKEGGGEEGRKEGAGHCLPPPCLPSPFLSAPTTPDRKQISQRPGNVSSQHLISHGQTLPASPQPAMGLVTRGTAGGARPLSQFNLASPSMAPGTHQKGFSRKRDQTLLGCDG